MLTPSQLRQLNTDRRMRISGKAEEITRTAVEGMAVLSIEFYNACLSLDYFADIDRAAIKTAPITVHKSCACDAHEHPHDHQEGEKREGYNGNTINALMRALIETVGASQAQRIFTAGDIWQALATGRLSPLIRGYADIITEAFRWAWGGVNSAFDKMPRLFRIQAGTSPKGGQLAYNEQLPWVEKLEKNGFDLVTSKITKLQLPRAIEIITNGVKARVPAQQLAGELNAYIGEGGLYHWRRLVRSEMATAIDRASKEQYKTAGIPYVKWNASVNACPKCAAISRRNMGYYTLAAVPAITADTHPNCLCNCTPVYRLPKDVVLN